MAHGHWFNRLSGATRHRSSLGRASRKQHCLSRLDLPDLGAREFPPVLEVTSPDDERLDAQVQLGSPADEQIRDVARKVVECYLQGVRLQQRQVWKDKDIFALDPAGGHLLLDKLGR